MVAHVPRVRQAHTKVLPDLMLAPRVMLASTLEMLVQQIIFLVRRALQALSRWQVASKPPTACAMLVTRASCRPQNALLAPQANTNKPLALIHVFHAIQANFHPLEALFVFCNAQRARSGLTAVLAAFASPVNSRA
jgi:hypothetical protein